MHAFPFLFSIIIGFIFWPVDVAGQMVTHPFSVSKAQSIRVIQNQDTLRNAWTGGINASLMQSIDINLDGKNDILVFERHGNKIYPFINQSNLGESNYQYSPAYTSVFPALKEWCQVVDYNKDGYPDLFTYSSGGILVYKNTSAQQNSLSFEKTTDRIMAKQYNNLQGIFLTSADYPAIADIDKDGDVDILTFFGLGSWVHFYKNTSIETYGHADSLIFELSNACWGNFMESEFSNQLVLDTSCQQNASKHTGSTLTLIDIDKDNDMDLILGDTDYDLSILLKNTGDSSLAKITHQDTLFPSPTPIRLTSFPVITQVDFNNDNTTDLIASSFDPAYYKSNSHESAWAYQASTLPYPSTYTLSTKRFLQEDMIDMGTCAYPVLFDIDNDGLLDLLIGNYGQVDSTYSLFGTLYSRFVSAISYYKNTGTAHTPIFSLASTDFGELKKYHEMNIFPSFGDIDTDGDIDMIFGTLQGKLFLLKNTSSTRTTYLWEDKPILLPHQVQGYATPQLFDLEKDGLLDIICGTKEGNLVYYQNTGTPYEPLFTEITSTLGDVQVTDFTQSWYGYSTPHFFYTSQGELMLFVGAESGKIHSYKPKNTELLSNYSLQEQQLLFINEGLRTAVHTADLNNDSLIDLLIGNFAGGLSLYLGDSVWTYNSVTEYSTKKSDIIISPNPTAHSFSIQLNKPYHTFFIEIYSMIGQRIETYTTTEQIDVSTKEKGMYLLKIYVDNEWVTTQKLLIY